MEQILQCKEFFNSTVPATTVFNKFVLQTMLDINMTLQADYSADGLQTNRSSADLFLICFSSAAQTVLKMIKGLHLHRLKTDAADDKLICC